MKRAALFILELFTFMNLFLPNAFSVELIRKNENGSYSVTNRFGVVWTEEESMYRGGARTVFRVSLKCIRDEKKCKLIYDRLLSFLPHDSWDVCMTIAEIDGLIRFIFSNLPNTPPVFKLDSIDIFWTYHYGFDYKLDIVNVEVSPCAGGFVELPPVNFVKR